ACGVCPTARPSPLDPLLGAFRCDARGESDGQADCADRTGLAHVLPDHSERADSDNHSLLARRVGAALRPQPELGIAAPGAGGVAAGRSMSRVIRRIAARTNAFSTASSGTPRSCSRAASN